MSYRTASAENYTMIDDLPDLDDLEKGPGPADRMNNSAIRQTRSRGSQQYAGQQPVESKYEKFISKQHITPKESGMGVQQYQEDYRQQQDYRQQEEFRQQDYRQQEDHRHVNVEHYQKGEETTDSKHKCSPSCLDIAGHVSSCPICTKFYNDDRTIYIIAIIVLAVICILLLKKVLDTN